MAAEAVTGFTALAVGELRPVVRVRESVRDAYQARPWWPRRWCCHGCALTGREVSWALNLQTR